jgi:hypothetical protein
MNDVVGRVTERLNQIGLVFSAKPIVIGGMAMEYYGMRKAGADIDLLISNCDYHALAEKYPGNRKDLYGDLGVVIEEFEIWRSIALLDYDFFRKDAMEEGNILIVSIDRLLWMRVCAMGVEKYRKDLELMKEYYYSHFSNQDYLKEARLHENSYARMNGAVFGGKYSDE